MKTKEERRARHLNAPRVGNKIATKSTTTRDSLLKSAGKTYKVIKQGKSQYYIELKLTK